MSCFAFHLVALSCSFNVQSDILEPQTKPRFDSVCIAVVTSYTKKKAAVEGGCGGCNVQMGTIHMMRIMYRCSTGSPK